MHAHLKPRSRMQPPRVGADGFYAVGALDEEMAGAAGEKVEDGLGLAGTTRSAET